jgi:pimeloyl-ACP methyl ester carboxylesterase
MSENPQRATVVLVHGAWHGAWCWDAVVPLLDAAGVPSVAVDLPGHGASTEPVGDLYTDADHVRGVLGSIDGPIVLAGHSYGGAVISEAASGVSGVRSLVYLCAIVPDIGETVTAVPVEGLPADEGSGGLGELIQVHEDGTTTIDDAAAAPFFYGDCAPATAADSLKRLSPQSSASFVQPLRHAAWREIPSTYVVCTGDQVIAVPFQRALASRAGSTVVEWPTSHSPFLSRPDLVAALLVQLAGGS